MSILDIFKPKWKNSDAQVRRQAVKELHDQQLLFNIITNDSDIDVKRCAVKNLTDLQSLESILVSETDTKIKNTIQRKLDKLYIKQIQCDENCQNSNELIDMIVSEESLTTLAIGSKNEAIYKKAIERVTTPELLQKIVRSAKNKRASKLAIEKIDDKDVLQKIVTSAPSKQLKKFAQKRIDAIDEISCGIDGATVNEKLEALCHQAEEASHSLDWQKARDTLKTLDQLWDETDPNEEYNELKQKFNKHRQFFKNREIAHQTTLKAILAKEEIITTIKELFNNLESDVISEIDCLKEKWNEIEGIPAEKAELLDKEFNKLCEELKLAKKELEDKENETNEKKIILESLCVQIESLVAEDDIEKNVNKFDKLKEKWNKIVKGLDGIDELEKRFQNLSTVLTEKKAKVDAELKSLEEKSVKKLKELCTELGELVSKENIKENVNRVKELQTEFKQLSPFKNSTVIELEKKFKDVADQFFGKLKTQYETEDLERWAHYTKLQDLAKTAEHLLDGEVNCHEVINKIKELRKQWKEVGPAPREKADEIWNRFNVACEKAFTHCREFFDKLDSERNNNLAKKIDLCEKVEILKDSSEWKATAEAIKAIQAEWKTIGQAPKDKEQGIYERFRTACDHFFNRRKAEFVELDKERAEHGKAKENLCKKASGIIDMDWSEGNAFAKELRAQWKSIGAAPRSEEEKLWDEFNGYINAFYNKFDAERPINLEKKLELCDKIEELLKDLPEDINFREINNKVVAIKKSWDSIGPVPKDKDKEIWERFNAQLKPFYAKRKAFFAKSDAERTENMAKKVALIEHLEKVIAEHENWKDSTNEIKQIQAEWKKIGQAPKEYDQDLWTRYKEICDNFFAKRQEFYSDMDSKRQSNLKRKLQICVEIEKIVGSEPEIEEANEIDKSNIKSLADELKFSIETNFNLEGTTKNRSSSFERIKELQSEWKKIGPVPKDDDKALFTRYRTACDKFFDKSEV